MDWGAFSVGRGLVLVVFEVVVVYEVVLGVKSYSQLIVDCSRPVVGSGGRSVSFRIRV